MTKLDQPVLFRYCSTPADLASLHTLCRTAHHRLEALKATVLASSACGLGVTGMCQVTTGRPKIWWNILK